MKMKYGKVKILISHLALITGAALVPVCAFADDLAQNPQNTKEEARDIIIVTGEKASRTLQKTDTSVSVVTAKRLRDENIQNLYDVLKRTANVTDTYSSNGFSIRGIRNDSVTGGGSGDLATVYFDGAALPINAISGSSALNMWDVGQVEVFRGPQSTLQGLNALAGTVIINSTDPGNKWDFRSRAIVSDYDETSLAIAAGGPLSDTFGFRIAIEDTKFDGSIYNPTQDTYIDESHTTTYRAKAVWKPTDALKLGLSMMHIEHDGGYQYSYATISIDNYWKNRINYSNTPSTSEAKVDLATLKANYRLNDKWTIDAIISGNNVKTHGQYDGDYTPQNISWGITSPHTKTISEELRFNYKGDRLHGLVGLYHMQRDSKVNGASLTNVILPKSTLVGLLTSYGIPAASATAVVDMYAQALPNIPVQYQSYSKAETDNSAIFFDGTYQLTEKLSIVGGLRYDTQDYTNFSTATSAMNGAFPNPTDYGPYATIIGAINSAVAYQVAQAGGTAPEATRNFTAWLPKLGIRYQYTPDISAAFIIQRGYRAGGSEINTARSTVVPYDPEYTWNYEASLRTAWFDNTLTLNANTYYIDWTDQQVYVNMGLNAYDNQVQNAGKSHLYGFEIEASHRLSSNFQYYASFGYARSKFDDFTFTVDAVGRSYTNSEFAYNPHVTATIGSTYRTDDGWLANLNASYTAGSYKDADNANVSNYEIDSRTIFNTKIGYKADHYSAYIFANNLFDEKYVPYVWAESQLALIGKPRTIGLILETKW